MSTINGLGKTFWTFVINILGLGIRILSVFSAIPIFGMQGYLWGLLASQFAMTLLAFTALWIISCSSKTAEKNPQITAG